MSDVQLNALHLGTWPGKPGSEAFTPDKLPGVVLDASADLIELRGFKLVDKEHQDASADLGKLSFNGLNGGKLKSFVLEDLAVNPPTGEKIVIKSLTADDLDYTPLLEALSKGEPLTPDKISQWHYSQAVLKGFEMSTSNSGPIKLAEVTVSNLKQKGAIPTSLTVAGKGFEIAAADLRERRAVETLKALGYDRLLLDFGLDYDWKPDTKEMDLRDLSFKLDQAADLTIKLALSNVDFEQAAMSGSPMPLAGAALRRLEIEYKDASLADRILKMAAAQQNVSPDQFRAMIVQMLQQQKAGGPGVELAAQIDGLTAFVQKPESLKITAEPASPTGLMQLQGLAQTQPGSLDDQLNLTIVVNDSMTIKANAPAAAAPQPSSQPAPQPAPQPSAQPAPQPAAPGGTGAIKDWMKKEGD